MKTVLDLITVEQAFVTGRVVDAATGAPPRTPFRVVGDRPAAASRSLRSGRYCVSAPPEALGAGLELQLQASAPGYRDGTRKVTLPVPAGAPLRGADIELSPFPVRIQGRVRPGKVAGLAVGHARVILEAKSGVIAALRRPLRRAFAAGSTVRQATPGAAATALADGVEPGATALRLLSPGTIGAGAVLALGWPDPTEAAEVQALGPGPDDVTLTAPVELAHASGTTVQEVTLAATGARLTRPSLPGDGVLVIDAAAAHAVVEVREPAGPRRELRRTGAEADDAGYYVVHGVTAVQDVKLTATATGAGASGPAVPWAVDYGIPANVVNLPAS